jgi:ElaB/YqjD/DUF883 family membrane-anchored ribosome-binding protein
MVKAITKRKTRTFKPHRATRVVHNGLDLQHRLDNIKDSLGELGDSISDKTARIVAKSIRKASVRSKRVSRYVSKKPYRSLGFAVVTAVCLGFLFRRI